MRSELQTTTLQAWAEIGDGPDMINIERNRKSNKNKKKSFAHNEAYLKGLADFRKGNLTNPYRVNTYYWKEWQRGFDNAYFENLAIYA